MLKKLLISALLLFPMLAFAQSLKIGIVDTAEILQKLPDTKDAQAKLAEVSQKYEDEYQKLTEEMKRRYDEINALGDDTPAAIKEHKTRDFQEFQMKIAQFEQTATEELQKTNQDLMAPIIQKVRNAIESVGKEGSYSLIEDYNPQSIFYFEAPVENITMQVKQKLGITE